MMDASFEKFLEENLKSTLSKIIVPDVSYTAKPEKKLKFRPAFTIAISILLCVALTAGAVSVLKVFSTGYRDNGLEKLNSNEYTGFSNLFCKDKGITLFAKAIVSDTGRTVIQVEVTGKLSGAGIPSLQGITLQGPNGTRYPVSTWGAGKADPHSRLDQTAIEFTGGPATETKLSLSVTQINGTDGNWQITIPVKPITSGGSAACNTTFTFGNGISFQIDRVTFSATETVFHGTYRNYFTIDDMGPVHSVVLYDNGKGIPEVEYGGNDAEFTVTTPPINKNDKIQLKFNLGIDHISTMTRDITICK